MRRVLLMIGGFLLLTLLLCIPIGVLGSSNLIWGEADQYGRVDVPGTGTLHLPAKNVEVRVAIDIVGKGNETVDVPVPDDLTLSVTPVDGGEPAAVTRDTGISGNTLDDSTNSQVKVAEVDVPTEGDYRVKAKGDFRGIGINAQLWFGHGPPIPGTLVPVIAAVLALLGGGIWFLILPRLRRSEGEERGWENPDA